MKDNTSEEGLAPSRNFASILNRMESVYLSSLRALALIIATLLLLYAGWLGITGVYKVSRSAESVKEAPAIVSADEVTNIDLKSARNPRSKSEKDPLAETRAYYQTFLKRYHALYRAKYEPFLQQDDPKTNLQQFDATFLRLDERLAAIKDGTLDFKSDSEDLEGLLKGVSAATEATVTQDRLRAYKTAKKSKVARTITETREQPYCSYYGYYINECITWSTRPVQVKRTVNETRLPDGVISPKDLFHAYHARYVETLEKRRSENAETASSAREEIVRGNAVGAESLLTATKVVGAFVILMFLFLLIALERHQRRIALSDQIQG